MVSSDLSLLFFLPYVVLKCRRVIYISFWKKMAGLIEISKGCCGSGTVEYGDSCKGLSTCADASKYVFWDAVHPTEKMYEIIADQAIDSLEEQLMG